MRDGTNDGRYPNFFTPAPKAPKTRPAQPPDNIPGASGKMNSPEKSSRNEKLKSLKAHVERLLDVQMNDLDSNENSIRILLLMIEFIEAMEEP